MNKEFKFYEPPFNIKRCAFNDHYVSAERDASNDEYLMDGFKCSKEAYVEHYGKEFYSNKKHHGYYIGSAVVETNDSPCIVVLCDDKMVRLVRECDVEWLPHTKTIH